MPEWLDIASRSLRAPTLLDREGQVYVVYVVTPSNQPLEDMTVFIGGDAIARAADQGSGECPDTDQNLAQA